MAMTDDTSTQTHTSSSSSTSTSARRKSGSESPGVSYKVLYTDGDGEDMNRKELLSCMSLFDDTYASNTSLFRSIFHETNVPSPEPCGEPTGQPSPSVESPVLSTGQLSSQPSQESQLAKNHGGVHDGSFEGGQTTGTSVDSNDTVSDTNHDTVLCDVNDVASNGFDEIDPKMKSNGSVTGEGDSSESDDECMILNTVQSRSWYSKVTSIPISPVTPASHTLPIEQSIKAEQFSSTSKTSLNESADRTFTPQSIKSQSLKVEQMSSTPSTALSDPISGICPPPVVSPGK